MYLLIPCYVQVLFSRACVRFLRVLKKLKWATFSNASIPKMFMENVQKNPNKVALIFEDQKWTFAQVGRCKMVGLGFVVTLICL